MKTFVFYDFTTVTYGNHKAYRVINNSLMGTTTYYSLVCGAMRAPVSLKCGDIECG